VRRRAHAVAVPALLAVYTGILYWRALGAGVISDGWVLLGIGSRGLREAPFVLLPAHTIPVANLFMAVLWKLFGLHQPGYQIVNLAELALAGGLLYATGRVLFGQARVALLASLLFLANSSFYEVPFWPGVGNFQSLAALLYLAGLLALARAFRSPHPRGWTALFSLCGLAAFFTYEPAVSLLGVGVLYAFLQDRDAGRRRWPGVLVAVLPALAVALGSKLYTAGLGYHAMFPPHDAAGLRLRLYRLVRGCVALFTLMGSDDRLYRVLTFGLLPPFGSPALSLLIAVWALALAAGGALLAWRARSPAVRFTVLWLAAHLLTVGATTEAVSRHLYLAALPASLLLSWGIWSAADRLAGRLARGRERAAAVLAGSSLALLVAGALPDLGAAAAVYRDASAASNQVAALVRRRLAAEPAAPPRVVLVNLPALLARGGVSAYAFGNGLPQLLRLSTDGRVSRAELFYTEDAVGRPARPSRPITPGELAARVKDPGSLVLRFDPRTLRIGQVNAASPLMARAVNR
jgi:hypothetical protein